MRLARLKFRAPDSEKETQLKKLPPQDNVCRPLGRDVVQICTSKHETELPSLVGSRLSGANWSTAI